MANIDLTIKTLDSRNHQFNISPELTVKEFKEHIASQVGTPAETQRLIYCGRVLQDEKKLSDYDLNGKVVHLVQRAPPSTNPPPQAHATPTRAPGARPGHVHYHLDRGFHNGAPHGYGPIAPPAGSSALLRLNTARRMLDDASQSLNRIATIPEGDGPLFVMDNTIEGNYSSAMPFAQAATAAALAAAFSTVQSLGGNNITVMQGPNGPPSVQGSFGFRVQGQQPGGQPEGTSAPPPAATAAPSTTTPTEPSSQSSTTQQQQPQVRNPRVSLFADVVEDVERIQQNLSPHLVTIRQLLRDDPALDPASADYRRAQHTFNQVSESLHYMAHAFHAMSDLMVDFGVGTPREVRARPYVYQQAVLSSTIPIHASISVETTHSRAPAQQQQQQPQQQQQQQAAPGAPPQRPAAAFIRQVARSTQHPSATRPATATTGTTPSPAPGNVSGWRATGPIGTNANQPQPRPPTVTMVGGPHPFGRLPMAMAGGAGTGGGSGWTPVSLGASMSPMVFMEVRSSSNGNNQEESASPLAQSPGSSSSSSSDFDDFLPCHSRHLARLQSRSPEGGSRPRSAPASTTTASQTLGGSVPRPGRPAASMTVPLPVTVADFVNEMLRQATEGDEPIGVRMESAAPPPAAGPALTNAMFSNLLQGVMQEVAGVMSGQQSTNTVAHFLRSIPDFTYAAGEAFLFDLFMNMAEHLTFRDLVSLFYGVPEALNRIRDHLRAFARTRLLDDQEFTETSIRQGVILLVNQSLPLLQTAAAEANIRPDVDFVATMISFFCQRFEDLVQLIGTPGENPNFGQQMMDHIRQSLTLGTALALSCFTDGVTSLERVFLSQLRVVSEGVHPMVQEWTTSSSLDRFRTLTASINMEQLGPTVAPMVMNTERGRTWRGLWSAEIEEAMDEPPPLIEVSSSSAASDASPVVSSATAAAPLAEQEESMIVEDDEPAAEPSSSSSSTSTTTTLPTPRRPRLEKLRAEVAANPPEPDSPPEDVVIGSQPWHRDVPREWVPVIARDIQRQSRSPVTPAPLSDAYLAGIPNKRRKMAQGDRPNSNPQILLRDTMERALRSANVSPPVVADVTSSALLTGPEVSAALRPELRRLGSARLDRDPDFEADRFPNADKYFHGV